MQTDQGGTLTVIKTPGWPAPCRRNAFCQGAIAEKIAAAAMAAIWLRGGIDYLNVFCEQANPAAAGLVLATV